MIRLEKFIKKYFILLIVLLPLRKMAVAITLALGPRTFLDHHVTYEEYEQGFKVLLDRIEIINVYLVNLIITIIISIDLKENRKLIGIPLLTLLDPVLGVTLFFIHKYYNLNHQKIEHEQIN